MPEDAYITIKQCAEMLNIAPYVEGLPRFAIDNNLNQIARYFNSGGMQTQAIREDINECIAALLEMRNAVIEMAGGQDGNHKAHRK